MRRRLLSTLGAASLLALTVPAGAAQAAPGQSAGCTAQLNSAASAKNAPPDTPYVVSQPEDADFFVLWVTGVSNRGTTNLTSCTFHDKDRNGRFDVKGEQIFEAGVSFTGDGDGGGSGWPYRVELAGVAQGEQVCSRSTMKYTPLEGGKSSTSTTRLTCFPVEFSFDN